MKELLNKEIQTIYGAVDAFCSCQSHPYGMIMFFNEQWDGVPHSLEYKCRSMVCSGGNNMGVSWSLSCAGSVFDYGQWNSGVVNC